MPSPTVKTLMNKGAGKMKDLEARTAVVGVGGAGCNVISDIFWNSPAFYTIAISTDKKAIDDVDADKKIFICKAVTHGEGTDGDSMLGKKCAQMHIDEIREALTGYDVIYIVAGLGGGTGTGAAPIVAEIAQSLNKIVLSIMIDPFSFETARLNVAKDGLQKMRSVCRMTTVIENDKILEMLPDATMEDAFHAVNASISRYITKQNARITSSFRQQIKNIGTYVEDDSAVPANDIIGNLVTN